MLLLDAAARAAGAAGVGAALSWSTAAAAAAGGAKPSAPGGVRGSVLFAALAVLLLFIGVGPVVLPATTDVTASMVLRDLGAADVKAAHLRWALRPRITRAAANRACVLML